MSVVAARSPSPSRARLRSRRCTRPGPVAACACLRQPREDAMIDQPQNWIAVASAEHVRRGRGEGFMQVCHGKAAPLRRVKPGSRVVYYSPTEAFGGKERLQAFTALGVVRD